MVMSCLSSSLCVTLSRSACALALFKLTIRPPALRLAQDEHCTIMGENDSSPIGFSGASAGVCRIRQVLAGSEKEVEAAVRDPSRIRRHLGGFM